MLDPFKLEVMRQLDAELPPLLEKFLSDIDDNWQPSGLLPESSSERFVQDLKEIQELALDMSYELWITLIGDTITEEALPTYEAWVINAEGIDQLGKNNWSKWVRGWSAEENRHGDVLNRYLYLSGVVNMVEVEITTQHLINDGFDTGMGHDPYKNFIYTSFQELATNVSHRRTATLAKKAGNHSLAKICGLVAADEMRHYNAYSSFMDLIFGMDPNGAMTSFNDMMRRGITMPAHLLRESRMPQGEAFTHFSECAQAIGVYTAYDYIDIYNRLLKVWQIDAITGLNDEAERARDQLMKRPKLIEQLAQRTEKPSCEHDFKWVNSRLKRNQR